MQCSFFAGGSGASLLRVREGPGRGTRTRHRGSAAERLGGRRLSRLEGVGWFRRARQRILHRCPQLFGDRGVVHPEVVAGASLRGLHGGDPCLELRLLLEELLLPLRGGRDRKSTRLNSSHVSISYAVFCLKKKKQ